ncbi:MAG: formylmethanofuran dehydrogenase subunit C [Promethearchaeati archaeon SRVP18_Atabeyarchaeia-1]
MVQEIILVPKSINSKVPIEAEVISPDKVAGKTVEQILGLTIFRGNRQLKLKDVFDVKGIKVDKPEDIRIVIQGDIPTVKRVGEGMTAGEIIIKGSAGMHVGNNMRGGKITVEGNAGDWAGALMKGGEITIKGNAGSYLGASYRGEWRGTSGGTILVEGNAGNEIGSWMSNGTIVVKGSVGAMAGIHLKGGVIVVHKDAAPRAGGEMTKGKIIILGRIAEVLPSFKSEGKVPSTRTSEEDGEEISGPFNKFVGDLADGGKGELYLKA